jgi:hypothetical protein
MVQSVSRFSLAKNAKCLREDHCSNKDLKPDDDAHSRGWTGGAVDALFSAGAATVATGASGWFRVPGMLLLIAGLGPATAGCRACRVAVDRLRPQECAIEGPAV